ncbi:MAG: hypothetical protein Q8T09_12995 [Candidatus Melainabacteria bacterium]|nr:hypothetical protein [Candidatus Melainabacteria bacterium]
MFNRNGDLEQKPAKNDNADAKSPVHHDFDLGKAMKQAGDAIGKVQNDMIERVTNAHVKQQYVASISPALANQYVRGRDIMLDRGQLGKSTTDLSDLSTTDRKAAEIYQRLHSDLPSKIPFYSKESLANDLDRDIIRKARSQPVASPVVAAASTTEAKPNSRSGKAELRQAVKSELGSKPDAKGHLKADAKPGLKPDAKPDAKPLSKHDPKSEPLNLSHQSSKVDLKAPAKFDSKAEVRSDSKPLAVAAEKMSPPKKEVPNNVIGSVVPGNALLTALSKNKGDGENKIIPKPNSDQHIVQQQIIQSSRGEHYKRDSRDVKNPPPPSATQKGANSEYSPSAKLDTKSEVVPGLKQESRPNTTPQPAPEPKPDFKIAVKPDFRPEPQSETKPEPRPEPKSGFRPEPKLESKREPESASSQMSRSHKPEVGSERREETKVLPASSSSDQAKAPSVRLIPVSQSNIATAHRDGAISVVRQLSDRIACSSIRVIVAPSTQVSSKPGIKLDAQAPENKSGQVGSIIRFDSASSAVPRPMTKNEAEANLKSESKAGSISDSTASKPYSSSKPGEPVVDKSNIDALPKSYQLKCQETDLKYITGPEIALSAIIAIAGIAKLRTDQSIWQVDSAMSTPLYVTEQKTEARTKEIESSSSVHIRPRILVGANDSLVSIAEQLFNDSGIAWLILKLNSDLQPLLIEGKTVVRLRSRQEIFVPVYQDIIDFQKLRTKEMCGQNLITVVEENQIDREIIDLALAPILGHNSSNIDPFQPLQPLEIEEEEV